MKKITPFGALLGTAALTLSASDMHRGAVNLPQPTFAAPGTAGPSHGTDDRRTHQPADLGHGAATTASMASFAHKMTHAAEGLGGGTGGKFDAMTDGDITDTGHIKADTGASVQAGEAAGAVDGETSKA